MAECDSAGLKHVAEEQTAVARGRIFLAAHDGDAMLRRARFETLNALDEQRRFREPLVDYVAIRIIERGFDRLAAEFPAQEKISNARRGKRFAERLLIEVRRIPSVWPRADVDEYVNPVLFQKLQEDVHGVIRVPDREDASLRVTHHFSASSDSLHYVRLNAARVFQAHFSHVYSAATWRPYLTRLRRCSGDSSMAHRVDATIDDKLSGLK